MSPYTALAVNPPRSLADTPNTASSTSVTRDSHSSIMDLLSLPSEMLASVLKYTKNLLEIRKISSVVDSTVKRFRISTTKFSRLRVRKEDWEVQVCLTPSFQYPVNKIVRYHNFDEPLLNILQYYFSKMDQFRGMFRLNDYVISEDTASFLLTQRAIKISELVLCRCYLTLDMQLLRKVLTTFNIRRLTLVLRGPCPFNEICEDLQFDELDLGSLGPVFATELTMNDLKQICSRKLPRKLCLHIKDVKDEELEQFLEKTINDSFDTIRSRWALTIRVWNLERVKNVIIKLKCFENHKMSWFVLNNLITFHDKASEYSIPFLKIRLVF